MDLRVRSQSDYITDWLQHLEAENYDPKTIYAYAQRIRRFENFLQGKWWGDVRPGDLDRFRIYLLRVVALTPASCNMTISTLRRFYSWLHWTEVIEKNFLPDMKGMKAERALPRPIDEPVLERMMEVAKRKGLFAETWIEVQYSTGCRVSEVLALKWSDVHLEVGYASVIGKGGRGRNVPLGRFAIDALRRWKAMKEKQGIETSGEASVWRGPYGGVVSYKVVSKMLKHVAKLAGVKDNVTTHQLRHSMATHTLDRVEDVRAVQELLGHADIRSTQIYTHVSPARMLRVFRKGHPRA